jgi:hypothetical protein
MLNVTGLLVMDMIHDSADNKCQQGQEGNKM